MKEENGRNQPPQINPTFGRRVVEQLRTASTRPAMTPTSRPLKKNFISIQPSCAFLFCNNFMNITFLFSNCFGFIRLLENLYFFQCFFQCQYSTYAQQFLISGNESTIIIFCQCKKNRVINSTTCGERESYCRI